MPSLPNVDVTVDINLFVYNGEATVGPVIESVLAQTWPAVTLTLIDDGSTDRTPEILAGYAGQYPRIRLKHNRCNGGAIASFQRALWFGNADFVMPKSGDDMIAPDFIESLMGVLQAHPEAAMCHAAGLVFRGDDTIVGYYPPAHCLDAVGATPLARARHVMARYTSSPSFWGVYRRAAVDRLSPILYAGGLGSCAARRAGAGRRDTPRGPPALLAARWRQAGDPTCPCRHRAGAREPAIG